MKVSLAWLRDYLEFSPTETAEKIADTLTDRGIEVESIENLSKGFEKVVVVQILKKVKHPDADRLNLCMVESPAGTLEIVCGAQNMKVGDKVACALEGASLPNGLKIKAGKIRGVVSQGMLCSESELGLKKESEGILILPPSAPLGANVAEVLGRQDTILELKLTPNRGDCASYLGVARELAAAFGRPIKKISEDRKLKEASLKINTRLEASDHALQFFGAKIRGVRVGPSPEWLVKKLESMGSRSINNVVDLTNFVLFETGQPTHAYDASKIQGGFLSARFAKKGEMLSLLDDSKIEFQGGELVIADGQVPVSLAGVMGGSETQVTDSTTEIFIECAEFTSAAVRKSASGFQKHTDASFRFEREIDPQGLEPALNRLVALICEVAGGQCEGFVKALHATRAPEQSENFRRKIQLSPEYLNSFLGLSLAKTEMKKTLESLGCEVSGEGFWSVLAPSFRRDLKIKQDIAEEIARCVGYDQIPLTLPFSEGRPPISHESESALEFATVLGAKKVLSSQGLYETISYSFTDKKWLDQFGLKSEVRVQNPMSEEQEYLIPALYPGFLKLAVENQNRHFGSELLSLRFFECRPVFHYAGEMSATGAITALSQTETGIQEDLKLGFMLSGPRIEKGLKNDLTLVDFFDVKGVFENLVAAFGTKGVRWQALSEWQGQDASIENWKNLYHPGQTAVIWIGKDAVGVCGRVHPAIEKKLKLRNPLYICELLWTPFYKNSLKGVEHTKYEGTSEFPPIERDFALIVKKGVTVEKILKIAQRVGAPLVKKVRVFDIYEGAPVPEGMTSIAVRVILMSDTRSLEEKEAQETCEKILEKWKKELGAELRS